MIEFWRISRLLYVHNLSSVLWFSLCWYFQTSMTHCLLAVAFIMSPKQEILNRWNIAQVNCWLFLFSCAKMKGVFCNVAWWVWSKETVCRPNHLSVCGYPSRWPQVHLQCPLFTFQLGAFILSSHLESILYKDSQNDFSMLPLIAHLKLFCTVMPTRSFKAQAATVSENHPPC